MSLSTGCVLNVDASAIESLVSRDRNHHTLTPTDCTTVRGKAGKGTFFNGTTSFVDCGNDSSLNITDAITIEAWAKMSSVVDSVIQTKHATYRMKIQDGNRLRGLIWIDGVMKESLGTIGELVIENYHHTIMTYDKDDGTNHILLFVDSQEVKYTTQHDTGGGAIDTGVIDLYIGGLAGYYFNGIIDNVRIYNRALSPTEIRRSYLSKAYLYTPHPVRIP